MAGSESELKEVHLALPSTDADIAALEPGNVVYLSGVVYTARERVYQKVLAEGTPLPVDLPSVSDVNFHCSPAAAADGKGGFRIGGVTATASFRFSRWMPEWLDRTGTRIIIGKGGMPQEDYRNVLAPRGAIYLTTVGYGTGALLGRGIRRTRDVFWLEELGLAQAMWLFEVDRFGPFIVDSDLKGESLFARHGARINEGLGRLYEGLRPPALHRYGETDDRKDELM